MQKKRIDIDKKRVIGQCMLGIEAHCLNMFVDHVVEDQDDDEHASSFDTLQFFHPQNDKLLPSIGHLQ